MPLAIRSSRHSPGRTTWDTATTMRARPFGWRNGASSSWAQWSASGTKAWLCAKSQTTSACLEGRRKPRRTSRGHGISAHNTASSRPAECDACLGLGGLAILDGRHEEGLELLRNAVAAAPLYEGNESSHLLNASRRLIEALFTTNAIDELEPLVPRYRDAAKAETRRRGCLCYDELQSLLSAAQFHEARGCPQEAEREVRALLDLLRENRARVQDMLGVCQPMLSEASGQLQILDPETGNQELIESWALELAKLRS
mmetsp:Transcript_38217/g.90272  ORF Transcript_38217/g.90272 Transcript_38217/m.90272 type:complete len:257 (+) Transcript_38217:224-994(+)